MHTNERMDPEGFSPYITLCSKGYYALQYSMYSRTIYILYIYIIVIASPLTLVCTCVDDGSETDRDAFFSEFTIL